MLPELLNEAFSHNSYLEDAVKSLMEPCLYRINQVYSSWRDNRHTHRTTTVPLAHAPRVNKHDHTNCYTTAGYLCICLRNKHSMICTCS